MKCEGCARREATVHLTEIIKEVKSEFHLCEICAKDIRLNLRLQNSSDSLQEILSYIDNENSNEIISNENCMNCGLTYIDFRRDMKTGCPACYNYFNEHLVSVISHHHGEKKYKGKKPANYKNIDYTFEEIDILQSGLDKTDMPDNIIGLKEKLKFAVSEERYEDAAKLRDRVRELERVE